MVFQRYVSLSLGQQHVRLFFSLVTGLFGSLMLYGSFYYITIRQQGEQFKGREWPGYTHGTGLDTRGVLDTRDLASAIGDLFGGSLPPTDAGAMSGLLSSLEGSITKLLGDAGGSLLDGLKEPSKYLGIGLASGALTGLNMTVPENIPTPTGVSSLTENLGSGLSSTILSSDSIKSLFNGPPGPGGTLGGSDGSVGQAVMALGQGLGSGASSGLKLATTAATTPAFNTSGISGIAGNFGEGLTSSLLNNVQLPSADSLMNTVKGLFGGANTTTSMAEIGTSLGTGIGEGAAIGLGFQVDNSTPPDTGPGIAEGFTKGLVSGFLQNDTVGKIMNSVSSHTANSSIKLPSIDFAKVAEGLAVGLVSGIGSTISTLDLISANTTSFNDSLGGAATGFGRGLGSEGAKLVSEIMDSSKVATRGTQQPKSVDGIDSKIQVRQVHYKRAELANATDLASVLSHLNASSINPLVQSGMKALSCEGVGGLIALAFGLVRSGTIKTGSINLKDLTSSSPKIGNVSLPDQEFIIKSGINTYHLNPAKGIGSVSVNGMGIYKFIVLAVAHILFAAAAHFAAIPIFLLAFNGLRVARILGQPVTTKINPTLPRWLTLLGFSIVPLTILTFGFGVGLTASAKHFVTPHQVQSFRQDRCICSDKSSSQILGGIVFLQILVSAAITQYLRQKGRLTSGSDSSPLVQRLKIVNLVNLGLLFLMTETTLFFSFSDLAKLSLCATQTIIPTGIWAAFGWILMGPHTLAVGLQVLILWLKRLERNKHKGIRERHVTKRRVWANFWRKPTPNASKEAQADKLEVRLLSV
ncbi:hypothetical protein BKA64DRAFT_649579 [Cadophora sp. MPI-SDFR-AT-0126]|nr:hypothetical protein BKA64DRAFT_649579 [Leotiomycetes sp. MPI-SDFR-AT-0126]